MALDIYLIRHAESAMNTIFNDRIAGRSNWVELTRNGVAQARALGEFLREERVSFDSVYSSPAIRTQQTARYCMESMGESIYRVELEPSIIELSQGDWEGKLRKEIHSRPDVKEGFNGDCWNYIPGDNVKGESPAMVVKRIKRWIEQIARENNQGIIGAFSHGLVIKYLLADVLELDKKTAYKIPIDNTGITIIRCEEGDLTFTKRNDSSHLDKAGLPKVKGVFED